ncbi:MAG: glycosyltransferase family 2 protein [Candidatus Cloacimonetes bacterium]|nr:glycosyltransferase family 2 protein [Candidatus Cloacimonadota bacterium]
MNELFSVIVPVYNSEKSLDELCSRVRKVFDDQVKSDFEMILVNDGSKDKSWEVMQKIHHQDSRIKIINLAKNCGQHSAMMCGLNNFSGDYAIFMDDDLQHPPEELPKLIKHIRMHPDIDVVIGTFVMKKHSIVRNIGSLAMNKVGSRMFATNSNIRFTNFRIIRRNIALNIASITIHRPRIGQLILLTTRNIASINVVHDPRKHGKSGYSFRRLSKDFVLNIINNSSLPLRLISYLGLVLASLSFLAALFYVLRYFIHGSSVKGWTSMIVLMSMYSGFILLSLGIIGEYLVRIYREARKMPNYVEREKLM